ncbi:SEC-C metal-binding domain-containing protein, partial [Candidatus Pelagibacter sp.]|nr:SEC-C metal-binding domain-containing protein [Candidatus Pelagibacter sp.]
NIFDYSDEFLKEIVEDIIKLKIQNLSNPQSNEFSNRLKQIVGKSFNELELRELISAKDTVLKEKIVNKFSESRDERKKLLGEDHAKEIEKRIFLQSIDLNWKSHIQYLEQLRQVIGLRSYGQRDPLVEYKKEAFDLFSNLLDKLKLDFVTILMNLKVVSEKQEENKQSMIDQIKSGKKIGRNEPCSCGSGKKFKHCCGAL